MILTILVFVPSGTFYHKYICIETCSRHVVGKRESACLEQGKNMLSATMVIWNQSCCSQHSNDLHESWIKLNAKGVFCKAKILWWHRIKAVAQGKFMPCTNHGGNLIPRLSSIDVFIVWIGWEVQEISLSWEELVKNLSLSVSEAACPLIRLCCNCLCS